MSELQTDVLIYGSDILHSVGMQEEKLFIQHRLSNTFSHSLNVANTSVRIAKCLNMKVDTRALVRGALLHDYFLYDCHSENNKHNHIRTHAKTALANANRDFNIGPIEKDIIARHMFPINIKLPRYKESFIVSVADKICAIREFFGNKKAILLYD